jgi:large subunit ribosomal protein L28
MAKCQICGKKTRVGWNVSHSHIRTRRKFGANIQKITFAVSGAKKQMKLCTKCIKKIKSDMKERKFAPSPKKVKNGQSDKKLKLKTKSTDDRKISKPDPQKRVPKSKKGK